MNFESIMDKAPELIVFYGTKIILALVIFFIGKWLAKLLTNLLEKGMRARSVDVTVTVFVRNISYYILLVVVIIATLGQLSVPTASFVAVIGAAGLAVGLALQGSLSNFAAGVMLFLFRPIRVGDYVEAGGAAGIVHDISIFATTLLSTDNKTIVVANASITGNNIVNYSSQVDRRIDLIVGVSYSSDLQQVKDALREIAKADERVLKDRDVTIGVSELANSSINLVFRPWVKTEDYWPVRFALTEKIKNRFDEMGISIPFPQMDVHVKQNAA